MALKQLDKAHRVVSGREAANASYSVTPRIIALGGDHTTTLSALRSTRDRWGPVSVIHFDSHIGEGAFSKEERPVQSTDGIQTRGIRLL